MAQASNPYYPSSYPTETDMNQADMTQRTDLRRRYPRDREGAKNEWQALIQHQSEMNSQIMLAEKELKLLKADQLGRAYNGKIQEDIQRREQELQDRHNEWNMMTIKIAQFKADLARQKLDKQTLQHILAGSYENYMREQQDLLNEEKQRKLEYELRELEENRRRLESERRRRAQAKRDYTDMAHDQINIYNERKNMDKQDQMRFRDEYNHLVNQNIQRDIMKEENYRNFYKMTADHQRHLEGLHSQNVLADYQRRDQRINDKIERGVVEAEHRATHKALMDQRNREEAKNDLRTTLTNQLEFKREQENFERQQRQRETEISLQKSADYQSYLKDVKNQRVLQQKQYKDILDRQHQEWEDQQRANRMTKNEKKINFDDLQAYKSADPQLRSLMPGFKNSKYDFTSTINGLGRMGSMDTIQQTHTGDSPLRQYNVATSPTYKTSATNILSNQLGRNLGVHSHSTGGSPLQHPTKQTSNDNIFFRPQEKTYNNQYANAGVNGSMNGGLNGSLNAGGGSQVNLQSNIIRPREPRANPVSSDVSPGIKNQKNTSLVTDGSPGGHNPITNPMPFNVQNPYVLRQMQGVGRTSLDKNAFLANVGNNSLLAS